MKLNSYHVSKNTLGRNGNNIFSIKRILIIDGQKPSNPPQACCRATVTVFYFKL